jgi:transcriptional regulator with XRE-family HTH domain
MTDDWYSDATATFGDRVTAAREAAGLSQRDVARRLGLREATVVAWEDDQADPRANKLQMLAGLLNVSLMWILTGEGPGLVAPAAPGGEAPQPATDPGIEGLRAELGAARRELARAAERLGRLDSRLAAVLAAR